MALQKNAINFGNGFNIGAVAPIDSRSRVQFVSDLTTAWTDTIPAYQGMVVTVMYDETQPPIKDENGEIIGYQPLGHLYVLKDTDATNAANWVRISTDSDNINSADEVYNALTAYTATTKVTLDNVDADITSIKEDISGITADVTDIKDDVADIYTKLAENEEAHQTLDDKISTGLTQANTAIAAIKSAYVNAAKGEGNVKTELSENADGNGKELKVTLEWQEF